MLGITGCDTGASILCTQACKLELHHWPEVTLPGRTTYQAISGSVATKSLQTKYMLMSQNPHMSPSHSGDLSRVLRAQDKGSLQPFALPYQSGLLGVGKTQREVSAVQCAPRDLDDGLRLWNALKSTEATVPKEELHST